MDEPDEVEVLEEAGDDPDALYLEVYVADSDKGRIIGKHGRIANALRTLVRAAAENGGQRAFLDIVS